jgi:hypothetical protein
MLVPYQGKQVEAKSVTYLTHKEDFNEYQLVDDDGKVGKTIRIKTVVTKISKLEGEVGPDGNPIYWVQSQNVIAPMD